MFSHNPSSAIQLVSRLCHLTSGAVATQMASDGFTMEFAALCRCVEWREPYNTSVIGENESGLGKVCGVLWEEAVGTGENESFGMVGEGAAGDFEPNLLASSPSCPVSAFSLFGPRPQLSDSVKPLGSRHYLGGF